MFAFLAAHRRELFPDELFADLFGSGRGRPSVPADVVATVIVLQALHGLSDREAAEAVTFDLRWKAAAGLALEAASFHPTTLTYWRRRLAGSAQPNRIFDVVRRVVAETGALSGKTRRALDSTVLDDAVATQDTVTQLIAAIRRVRRDVPDAAAVIAEVCSAHDYDEPGKPAIAWDDAAGPGRARRTRWSPTRTGCSAACPTTERTPAQAEALALLALVAGQDVEWIDGREPRRPVGRGGSPDGSPRTGLSRCTTRRRGTRTRRCPPRRMGSRPMSRSNPTPALDHRLLSDQGQPARTARRRTQSASTLVAPNTNRVEVLGRLRLRHRRHARSRRRRRAHCRDQAYRRCGRRCPAGSPSTTSASTDRPAPSPARTPSPGRSPATVTSIFGGALHRLPAAGSVHHLHGRAARIRLHEHDALRRAHRRAGRRPRLPGHLPTAPAHGRTHPRLAGRQRQPPAALPRRRANNAWLHTRVAALNLRRLLALGLQAHRHEAWVIA